MRWDGIVGANIVDQHVDLDADPLDLLEQFEKASLSGQIDSVGDDLGAGRLGNFSGGLVR